ncbi:hypothetical protein [Polycyclovorans algicola]|uniref:hypothetical protein n=1 Tax=Polycyclovorans algicola TaxID=616992 RepID=UPI0012683CA5|nr:hypothetical protein [Polycyclovorans algicola]
MTFRTYTTSWDTTHEAPVSGQMPRPIVNAAVSIKRAPGDRGQGARKALGLSGGDRLKPGTRVGFFYFRALLQCSIKLTLGVVNECMEQKIFFYQCVTSIDAASHNQSFVI